jgi:hypothetical protein
MRSTVGRKSIRIRGTDWILTQDPQSGRRSLFVEAEEHVVGRSRIAKPVLTVRCAGPKLFVTLWLPVAIETGDSGAVPVEARLDEEEPLKAAPASVEPDQVLKLSVGLDRELFGHRKLSLEVRIPQGVVRCVFAIEGLASVVPQLGCPRGAAQA